MPERSTWTAQKHWSAALSHSQFANAAATGSWKGSFTADAHCE